MLTSRIITRVAKNMTIRNSSSGLGNAVAGPPANRVPFAEKAALGLIMTGSLLFVPAWVLVHLQEYKSH